ncbi:MAG: ATP-dependent RNA helicase HrpA [Kiritimatiellia bacterium]
MTEPLPLNYPDELPICAHRAEILTLLKAHPVIIVCGDTGSGKTTQLPKMAMELGRGANGRRIACTQPRRLAAVTVAARVAHELKAPLGGLVGFQHRFGRQISDETRVKFMTDGVLLAETRADPLLSAYDTIIIDEAHERSLNVDFLLGILKRILARRRDLKVIVSSATLDTEKFAKFFDDAPALVVPGRLFPIETRYRPSDGTGEDLPRDVAAAARELPAHDDILVFLPGERDIRETADHLAHSPFFRGDDIIPLLAALPASEQQRAFRTSSRRRIILATNVAETSVTIPGIRAVIDSGLARISRYIHRTQVQRLQIEPISQASARQRMGRCGRLGPGICIRLYSEEDFLRRDAYTPPEVLRASLAGVILTMLDLRLGDIENFPFIDPPRPAMIREGLRELLELGAIARNRAESREIMLTKTGRQLARIPVEPRLARMLLAASQYATLPSVLPLVAAMSGDDPRRRPIDEKEKADQAHAPFRVPGSDFLGTLKLWRWWEAESATRSHSQLRTLAARTYLSFPKMREWRDLVRQLTDLSRRLGLDIVNDNGGPDALHRALMHGLLSRLGRLDSETLDYRGAHGIRFALHPSSILTKTVNRRAAHAPPPHRPAATSHTRLPVAPEWVMAGELVDTTRLFARTNAVVDPRWIEAIAGPLCRHSYRDPTWDAENGFVRATEQVTLYGLVIVPARRRDYSRIEPVVARRLFLLHGLVLGEFPKPPAPVAENMRILDELQKRAVRNRRPDLFDIDRLTAFFDRAVPPDIVSAGELRKWLHAAAPEERARFRLRREEWLANAGASTAAFPETIRLGNARLALSYRHTPNDPETDGITCTVCKSDANVLRLWRADWLVPGALPEKVNFLLSSLPTALRRVLAPLADTVAILMPLLRPGEETLQDAIRRTLFEHNGIRLPADAWDRLRLPPHLRVRYCIRKDEDATVLACSRDLETALRAAGVADRHGGSTTERGDGRKHVRWDFGTLDESATAHAAGWQLKHYRALFDEGDGITVRLFRDSESAAAAHEAGVTRLIYLRLTEYARPSFSTRRMPLAAARYFKTLDYATSRLADDLLLTAIREAGVRPHAPVRDAATFERRLAESRSAIAVCQSELTALLMQILDAAGQCADKAENAGLVPETLDAIETQLAWLFYPGFVRTAPYAQLKQYPRYLRALALRIDRARVNPASDRAKEARFAPFWDQYYDAVVKKDTQIVRRAALTEYRWLLEEYRVSLFAQEVKTAIPVSPKRLEIKWLEATEG